MEASMRRRGSDQRGFGLIEILLVLVVVAFAGALIWKYVGSTAKTMEKFQEERPLANARLAADRATLDSVQGVLRNYYAENSRWPADKAAVIALLQSPPRFQCAGNDFEYDPASGTLTLVITDSGKC
jgi:prepilin-type N-terminal cleavage/methylation domain-containing protein